MLWVGAARVSTKGVIFGFDEGYKDIESNYLSWVRWFTPVIKVLEGLTREDLGFQAA
jgi:hypothetical protein